VGFEYDHIFLGNRTMTFTGSGNLPAAPLGAVARSERISRDVDIALIGVNYRWGGPLIEKCCYPSDIVK